METIFVKIPSHSNQFWDPTNKKQKMLVGRGIFEVQDTAEIQRAIADNALSKSNKEDFEAQEVLKKQSAESKEETIVDESPTVEAPKTPTKTTKK